MDQSLYPGRIAHRLVDPIVGDRPAPAFPGAAYAGTRPVNSLETVWRTLTGEARQEPHFPLDRVMAAQHHGNVILTQGNT